MKPANDLRPIAELIDSPSYDVRLEAVKTIAAWRLANQFERLAKLARDTQAGVPLQRAAISALAAMEHDDATEVLKQLCELNDRSLRMTALKSLATKSPWHAVVPVVRNLEQSRDEEQARQIWQAGMTSRNFGKLTAERLQQRPELSKRLPPYAVVAGIRAAQAAGDREQLLLETLRPLDENAPSSEFTAEMQAKLLAEIPNGDPAAGELVYRRAELACATCHAIGGAGGRVGPDITSIGASAPVDYLIESLFDPNAKVKEGFHSVVVLTEDDKVLSGVETGSTETELVLRTADNKLHRIPRSEIVQHKTGKSLMPTGTIERLAHKQQVDLLAFLSQLGRPGAFDASGGAVARQYEIFAGTHRREQKGADKIISGEMPGWQSVTAFVSGDLPRATLQDLTKQPINISLVHVYLRTNVSVPRAGTVTLHAPAGSRLWVDGNPIETATQSGPTATASKALDSYSAQLEAGTHQVIIRLDALDLPDAFRLESKNVAFVAE